jgi:hypothetical protein
MKTFQIFKNVSYEYFIEAETLEEAQNKIIEENPHYESEELIEWVYLDEHDGGDWKHEPVLNSPDFEEYDEFGVNQRNTFNTLKA